MEQTTRRVDVENHIIKTEIEIKKPGATRSEQLNATQYAELIAILKKHLIAMRAANDISRDSMRMENDIYRENLKPTIRNRTTTQPEYTDKEAIECTKEIYTHIVCLNLTQALEYLNSLYISDISIQKMNIAWKILKQMQQFKIMVEYCITNHKHETLYYNSNNFSYFFVGTNPNAPIFELAIKMKEDGLVMAKDIIASTGITYMFNQENKRGWLYYATIWDNDELVKWLLEQACEEHLTGICFINTENSYHQTALDVAEDGSVGNSVVAKILRAHGGLHSRDIPKHLKID
jgi:hypothetical protein